VDATDYRNNTAVSGGYVAPYSRSAVRAPPAAPVVHVVAADFEDDVVILPPLRVEHVVVDSTDDT